MHISYVATPAENLPQDVHAVVIEGDGDIVIQVSEGATPEQVCEALTQSVNAHAAKSWVHVGAVDWENVTADQPDVSPQP